MDDINREFPIPIGASTATTFSDDGDDNDDIEALARKTSDEMNSILNQLDTTPQPPEPEPEQGDEDGNRFTIDEEKADADEGEDMLLSGVEVDNDTSLIGLVGRTSQMLSDFQDYVSGPENAVEDILEGGGEKEEEEETITFLNLNSGDATQMKSSMASTIRNDNKMRVLENGGSGGDVNNNGSSLNALSGGFYYQKRGNAAARTTYNDHLKDDDGKNPKQRSGLNDWGEEEENFDADVKMIGRGQKYTHPLLQSKRVKFGLINCVLVAVIVFGVSLGVSSNNKKAGQELDNQIGHLEEELAEGTTDQDKNSDKWKQEQTPHVTVGQPTSKSKSGVMTEVVDENGANGDDIEEYPVLAQEEMQLYESAATHYQPKEFNRQEGWLGKTYLDAYEFCGEQNYDICPYDAICPLGPDSQPLGGYKERIEGSWVAIADRADDWVQLSRENACVKYSFEHPNPPEWGISGDEDADEVAHVMCCMPRSKNPVNPESSVSVTDDVGPSSWGLDVGYGDVNGDNQIAASPELTEQDADTYHLAIAKYRPNKFSQQDGWIGKSYSDAYDFCTKEKKLGLCPYVAICPLGPDTQPTGGYWETDVKGASWIPILNSDNEWIQLSRENTCTRWSSEHPDPPQWGIAENEDMVSKILCCVVGSVASAVEIEEEEILDHVEWAAYGSVAIEFLPMKHTRDDGWEGKTYLDAAQFCGKKEGFDICPTRAICPLGPNHVPMGGYSEIGNDGDGGPSSSSAWVPVSDAPNSWIGVSSNNSCLGFRDQYSEDPVWGLTGENNEELTQTIMCCKGSIFSTGEESFLFQTTAEKYRPMWHSRADGWVGQTYDEAVAFCQSTPHVGKKRELCPYAAYCPIADMDMPIGDVMKDEPNGSWVAIGDASNGWISVGPENTCKIYDVVNGEPPEWGTTGIGNEEITRHIMCCDAVEDDDIGAVSLLEDGDQTTTIQAYMAYQAAANEYEPKSYDRSHGWRGQTYDEAFRFCGGNNDGRTLCPYDAICPAGPNSEPLGGFKEDSSKSWMPISNHANDWVRVSKENACITYSSLHSEEPDWGMTGEEDEEITRHVMCCLKTWQGGGETTEADGQVQSQGSVQEQALSQMRADDEAIDAVDHLALLQPTLHNRDDGWEGKTYLEAVRFCAREEGYSICSYHAICPFGPNSKPFVGYRESSDGGPSWVPVSDSGNSWVNLSRDNSCIRYNIPHSEQPEGNTAMGSEEGLENIMCCKGSITGTAEESFLYENVGNTYHPRWYGRDKGWTGQTYDEAVDFCTNTKHEKMCPYEAYCPMYEFGIALGGLKEDEPNGSWAPLGDAFNAWVSVGPENTCHMYAILNGESPEWGIAGIGNEEITRHIMCCEHIGDDGIDDGSQQQVVVTVTSQSSKDPTPSSEAVTAKEDFNFAIKYNPVWYDRSSGWVGQTYDAAYTFCSRQGPGYDVCPYAVICPGGPMKTPYGGAKDGPNGVWAPVNDAYNEWVQVSDLQVCVDYKDLNPRNNPVWGLTGDGNEEITRHIACCDMNYVMGEESIEPEISGHLDSQGVNDKYGPKWYTRDDGWVGNTFVESIGFCSQQDSAIPCPYEAYCPDGPGSEPIGGSRQEREVWAPIMDSPNGWVNVGSSSDSCKLYNSLHPTPPLWGLFDQNSEVEAESGVKIKDMTAHIMCCREPPPGDRTTALQSTVSAPVPIANTVYEQDILDKKHPIWFSRKHGYHGNTHDEAADFCKSIGDMVLCAAETYCPEGNADSEKPLFLKRNAFEGEQWAPVATTNNNALDKWILVGTLDGQSQSTCATFSDVKEMKPEGWNADDGDSDLKENVLCCLNPNHLLKEMNFAKDLDKTWLGESFGWKGGSHNDATEFCQKLGNKKLCPYTAYCPHGAGRPVIGGHVEDFNMIGEQWAPVYQGSSVHHEPNHWVMIGQKYQNSATTCMDNLQLEGREPEWGISNENADMKRHIMCCSLGY